MRQRVSPTMPLVLQPKRAARALVTALGCDVIATVIAPRTMWGSISGAPDAGGATATPSRHAAAAASDRRRPRHRCSHLANIPFDRIDLHMVVRTRVFVVDGAELRTGAGPGSGTVPAPLSSEPTPQEPQNHAQPDRDHRNQSRRDRARAVLRRCAADGGQFHQAGG